MAVRHYETIPHEQPEFHTTISGLSDNQFFADQPLFYSFAAIASPGISARFEALRQCAYPIGWFIASSDRCHPVSYPGR
jgi:hypothetical protein